MIKPRYIIPTTLAAILLASISNANTGSKIDLSKIDLARYSNVSTVFFDLDGNKIDDGTPVLFEKKKTNKIKLKIKKIRNLN